MQFRGAKRHWVIWLAVASAWSSCAPYAAQAAEPSAAELEFFEKNVRPILAEHCFKCHGPKKQEGGLRLDSKRALLTGGETEPAIVPGKPERSLLIDAINYGDTYQMPPRSKLPKKAIDDLTRWVKIGAPWPAEVTKHEAADETFELAKRRADHWAWQPLSASQLPDVKTPDWAANAIDRYVLSKLEESGLTPAVPADRETLIRRVTFDVTGLPPTPDETLAFVNDDSPDAYERLVDRLLASPHFGERWARHWMDLVRYAETCGHEFDYPIPHAWRYRDYLIRAFNDDVPYDQFVVEHIAGDLLPNPRRNIRGGYNESIIGTGFWFLGEAIHSPVDVRGDEAGRIDNQIDVLSKTFLGLTLACSRCHDHKFDAISTRDYYAMAGYLQSSRRQQALLDPHGRIASSMQRLVGLHRQGSRALNDSLPSVTSGDVETIARYLLAARQLTAINASQRTQDKKPVSEIALEPTLVRDVAKQFDVSVQHLDRWVMALTDDSIGGASHPLSTWKLLSAQPEDKFVETVVAERDRVVPSIEAKTAQNKRQSTFEDFSGGDFSQWFATGEAFGSSPSQIGDWDWRRGRPQIVAQGIAHSGLVANRANGVLRSKTFEITHPYIHYRLSGRASRIRLIIDGYVMDEYNRLLFAGISFDVNTKGEWTWHTQNVAKYVGHRAHIELIDHTVGFLAVDQISFSEDKSPQVKVKAIGHRVLDDPNVGSIERLASAYARVFAEALASARDHSLNESETALLNWAIKHRLLETISSGDRWYDSIATLRNQADVLARALPTPMMVLAMADGTGEDERVHIRGGHKTLGDVVPRRFFEALDGLEQRPAGPKSGRMELARRVVDPKNPFVSRVFVNRLWHHLFGRGIVSSVDNFGVLGRPPSHPKLLDHLAMHFIEHGWSMKCMVRTMLLSNTYQMSNQSSASAEQVDPNNELLHRASVRRIEGEAIRDAILLFSGEFDSRMFGPSVPVHLTRFMDGRGRPKTNGPLSGGGRRSLYAEVRRNFLPPLMLAFDTPIPFSTVGRRTVSNVPAQALILLNDDFVVEQSKVWARRMLSNADHTPNQRINEMYATAFSRPPDSTERSAALEFLEQQGGLRGLSKADSLKSEATWADLCHVLLNVKELIFLH